MDQWNGTTTRWIAREVIIPWHVVGAPALDVAATIEACLLAIKVNRRNAA